MTSSQARDDEIATSATRSTRYPRERVRAEHGGAGGAVPAAAPAASKSVARSSASLGLHGAAALPEMSERKGTAVDRQAGKKWRAYSSVVSGCFGPFCPVHRQTPVSRAGRARSRVFVIANARIQKPSLLVSQVFRPRLSTMADPHHRAWLETRRGAWGEYGATPAGSVRAPAVVQCDSARNRACACT